MVQNRGDDALTDGRRAVRASPRSAAAKIALSYALQSKFELEQARDTLLQAVKDTPRDALAWARLAELWLSLGHRKQAREAASTATGIDPNLARTHTILGFRRAHRVSRRPGPVGVHPGHRTCIVRPHAAAGPWARQDKQR